MYQNRTLKLAIIGGALVVVILVAVSLLISAKRHSMGHLAINTAPTEITFTIDKKRVKNLGAIYVAPGGHKWEATFTNFTSKSGEFNIKKGEEQTLDVFLEPANEAGQNYLASHPDQARRVEGLVGKRYDQLTQKASEQTPLINQLPYIEAGYEFRVDYGSTTVDGQVKTTIYIESINDQATQDALDWIKEQGADPNTLNIVYKHRQADNYNVGHQ